MWKLYKVGSTDQWLRADGQIVPVLDYNFDDHIFSFVVDGPDGRDTWHTPTRNVQIIEQGEPDYSHIAVASLICQLNAERKEDCNLTPHTSRDQRFSYETHKNMGGRKLNGDR